MTDEQALLAAIFAHPAEDTHRLVYADWLAENGQPERASFIRVQVQLARMERPRGCCDVNGMTIDSATPPMKVVPCDCLWSDLRRRERELLGPCEPGEWGENAWRWFIEPSQYGASPEQLLFHAPVRGFLASLDCSWHNWLKHADAILARQPIERVKLTTRPQLDSFEYIEDSSRLTTRIEGRSIDIEWTRDEAADEVILRGLRADWPRIEFELPPVVARVPGPPSPPRPARPIEVG